MNAAKFLLSMLTAIFAFVNVAAAQDVQPVDGFYKKIVTRNVMDGDVTLVNQTYPMLCFSTRLKSDYPKLAKAIENYNAELTRTAKTTREQFADLARERRAEMSSEKLPAFYYGGDLLIRRADSIAVSVINSFEDYAGGAHGMHGWFGTNFDSQTGRQLTISDVCTDAGRLSQTLFERLLGEYDDRTFDDLETNIRKLIVEEQINFVLEPRGVTFIFNPYEIAPYAAGMLTVTILFDEQPELFKEKYRQSPKFFAQSIAPIYPTTLEMNGKRARLTVDIEGDRLVIAVDGRNIAAHLKDVQAMSYVQSPGGGHFLYVDARAETDRFSAVEGECITLFKLDGEPEMLERMPYTFRHDSENWWLMTDPNSIQFDSAIPVGDMYSHIGAVDYKGTFSVEDFIERS